jgi:hypothetical protein
MRAGLRAVASDAFAVALSAKVGGLTALAVEQLRSAAEAQLDPDLPLRQAVLQFATMFEADRRDPAALRQHGDELAHAVELALRPDPPDLNRRDIHG